MASRHYFGSHKQKLVRIIWPLQYHFFNLTAGILALTIIDNKKRGVN